MQNTMHACNFDLIHHGTPGSSSFSYLTMPASASHHSGKRNHSIIGSEFGNNDAPASSSSSPSSSPLGHLGHEDNKALLSSAQSCGRVTGTSTMQSCKQCTCSVQDETDLFISTSAVPPLPPPTTRTTPSKKGGGVGVIPPGEITTSRVLQCCVCEAKKQDGEGGLTTTYDNEPLERGVDVENTTMLNNKCCEETSTENNDVVNKKESNLKKRMIHKKYCSKRWIRVLNSLLVHCQKVCDYICRPFGMSSFHCSLIIGLTGFFIFWIVLLLRIYLPGEYFKSKMTD